MSFIHASPGTGGAHGWEHYTGASVSVSFQDLGRGEVASQAALPQLVGRGKALSPPPPSAVVM